MSGAGRAIDPAEHFVIIVNQIGSGLSTSPHNAAAAVAGPRFPRVRIADDVRAQHRLITERFGIEKLALVMGASMGAEQTFEWAVRYPGMVLRAAAIAGTARTTVHTALFVDTLLDALRSDPNFADGAYAFSADMHLGLRRHARLWAVMGASAAMYANKSWRTLGFASADAFVSGLLDASFLPLDPNALLVQGWKWQQADVSRPYGGDLAQALGRITAQTLVMPVSTDMFFTVADCTAEQQLIARSTLRVLHSHWGHLAVMGMDPLYLTQVDDALKELLATG